MRTLSMLVAALTFAFSVSAAEYTVGFAQTGAESMWRTANTDSIKAEAAKRGIKLVFSDAQQKQENQIKAIRSFIAQGVDIIGFPPIVGSGWEPVLQEAKDAGIPVITTDRRVDTSDDSLFLAFLGSDFVAEGEMAANWLVRELGCDQTAEVFELVGVVGAAPSIDRKKGFENVIARYPGIKIVKSQTGEFTRAKGKEVMEAYIKSPEWSNAKRRVVYGHNDDMVLGAIQAMEEAGINPGKEAILIGIDGVSDAFQAIVEGKMHCTVECNPLLGPQFFDLVDEVMSGKEIPREVFSIDGTYDYYCAPALLSWRKTLY